MSTYESMGHDHEHTEEVSHGKAVKYGYFDGVHQAAKYATMGLLALGALMIIPKKTIRNAVKSLRGE